MQFGWMNLTGAPIIMLLMAFGVSFVVAHICITWFNNRSEVEDK